MLVPDAKSGEMAIAFDAIVAAAAASEPRFQTLL